MQGAAARGSATLNNINEVTDFISCSLPGARNTERQASIHSDLMDDFGKASSSYDKTHRSLRRSLMI